MTELCVVLDKRAYDRAVCVVLCWTGGPMTELCVWCCVGQANQTPPPQLSDLLLVPSDLRATLAELATPRLNCLHIPPALLLSPLSARLRESVGAERHALLAQPIHELLGHANAQDWSRHGGRGRY